MGGEPRFCLVRGDTGGDICARKWIEEFYRGLLRLAKRTGTALAGGDLARADDKIHCDVMVCGAVPRGPALRRDGARLGDSIFVSGRLGKAWDRRIEPRLALGQSLRGTATSCIDLSDGLSLDLHRLCLASGVAAEIDRVPVLRGRRWNARFTVGKITNCCLRAKKARAATAPAIGRRARHAGHNSFSRAPARAARLRSFS